MIDPESRNKMAALLSSVLNGRVAADDVEDAFVAQASRDMAIWGILDQLTRSTRWLGERDCGDWRDCSGVCGACPRLDPKGDLARCSEAKRKFARAIEFLETDQEYRWAESTRIPWWMIPPAVVVLIIGVAISCLSASPLEEALAKHGIKLDEVVCMFGGCIITAIIWLASFIWLAGKVRGKDRRYWPFYGRKECEGARER
ncbi:MAG: hypothetical protein M1335_03760 [Chloroflexi bacterium]|nr:hypothetical protein [Chloroflexota bacterium]MCL5104141.1 hypothetical protein [Armatimonadota bacterium]